MENKYSQSFDVAFFRGACLGQIERLLLERCMEISGATGGTVYLVDPMAGRDTLHIPLAILPSVGLDVGEKGQDSRALQRVPLRDEGGGEPILTSPVPCVANTRKSINVADVTEDTDIDFRSVIASGEALGHPIRSFLAVPIVSPDDDLLGVLTLVNATDTDTGETSSFYAVVEEQLAELAQQVGAALSCRLAGEQAARVENSLVQLGGNLVDQRTPGDGGFAWAASILLNDLAKATQDSADGSLAAYTSEDWQRVHLAAHLRYFGWETPNLHPLAEGTVQMAECLWDAIAQNRTRACALIQGAALPDIFEAANLLCPSTQREDAVQFRRLIDVVDAFVSLTYMDAPEKKVLRLAAAHSVLRTMCDEGWLDESCVERLRQDGVCDTYFEVALNGADWRV